MSNPTRRVNVTDTLTQFLARLGPTGEANSQLIQQKQDKKGVSVTEGDSRTRLIAAWLNFFDDFLISFFTTGGGGSIPQTPDTVTTTDATPTIADTVTVASDTVVTITWTLVGREQGTLANAIYALQTRRYINTGGVLELWDVGATTPFDYSPSGTLTTAITSVSESGTDVELTVVGEAATTLLWDVHRKVEVFDR